MTEQQKLDFMSVFGEEFSDALANAVGWENITPHDGYEVFLRVFHQEPTSQLLAEIHDSQLETMLAGCTTYFENDSITCDMLLTAITRTLDRYPAEGTAS